MLQLLNRAIRFSVPAAWTRPFRLLQLNAAILSMLACGLLIEVNRSGPFALIGVQAQAYAWEVFES